MSGAALLRDGGAGDLPAVMTVMERAFDPAFGEAWNRAQCLGILALPDVWLILAEPGGGGIDAAVGFALARAVADDAELLLLAVDPAARGQGVGAALIERIAGIARARGAARLLLEMRDGNAAARLYARTGFAAIGRRRGYYRGPAGTTFDALTLARAIG